LRASRKGEEGLGIALRWTWQIQGGRRAGRSGVEHVCGGGDEVVDVAAPGITAGVVHDAGQPIVDRIEEVAIYRDREESVLMAERVLGDPVGVMVAHPSPAELRIAFLDLIPKGAMQVSVVFSKDSVWPVSGTRHGSSPVYETLPESGSACVILRNDFFTSL
jgi:hypothetical protein